MTHTDTSSPSHEPLAPLGSTQRTATAADQLAETYFHESLALNPSDATFLGFPGHETEYPDFGPAGRAARAELVRSTLARLEEVTPEDDVDRVTLHAMRNELELERDRHEANLDVSAVNNIESPVQGIRQVLDAMPRETEQDWKHIAGRMTNIPAALEQYRAGLDEAVSLNRPPSAPQIVEASQQAEQYASDDGFFASLAADPAAPDALRDELRAASDAARAAYRDLAGITARAQERGEVQPVVLDPARVGLACDRGEVLAQDPRDVPVGRAGGVGRGAQLVPQLSLIHI